MKSLVACVLSIVLPAAAWAADYQFRAIDFPGSANTAVYAINNRGQFVGAEKDTAGLHHALIGKGAQLALIDPSGPVGTSPQSWAYSISRGGDVAGAILDAAGSYHGYVVRAGGAVEILDYPGGFDTQAYGINEKGTVIGTYNDAAANPHAFVLCNGSYRNADLAGALQTYALSINEADEIAGEYVQTAGTIGFGYVEHRGGRYVLSTAPGSAPEQTFFISINNRREVLGAYADSTGAQFNFIRKGGSYLPFDLPASFGASLVSAQTINDHEDVVGFYFDANSVAHGFVAQAARSAADE